jgi:hypothetical protein
MKKGNLIIFFGMVYLIVFSACRNEVKTIEANLKVLADTIADTEEQYEGAQGGLGGKVEKKQVTYENARCIWQNSGDTGQLLIKYSDSTGHVNGTVNALELPLNWKKYKILRARLSNPNAHKVAVVLKVLGPRSVLPDTVHLSGNASERYDMSLLDLPLTAGNKPPYKPNSVKIEAHGPGSFDVEISQLALVQTGDTTSSPVVDRFGQRIRGEWENKVKELEDIEQAGKEELEQLNNMPDIDNRGPYEGWTGSGSFEKTGYFHVSRETVNGEDRWWLVTPEGNPFWSLGVTCIRPKNPGSAVTILEGREFLFSELPDPDGVYGDAYLDGTRYFSFYNWNILRKYDSYQNWRERVFLRMEKWGLNSIGNWSDEIIMRDCQFPYTRSYNTNDRENLLIGKGLCDVFSPQWESYVDTVLSQAAKHKNDRMLMGYFIDNEAGWRNPELLRIAPKNAATRDKWLSMVRAQYGSLTSVNAAWNTNLDSWKAVRNLNTEGMKINDALRGLIKKLESAFARQYFRVVSHTLKKYDPNHMYLGARFTKFPLPEHILEQAGDYCDVVTVNVYDLVPDKKRMHTWYERTGRPILIGEHHLPLKTERQLPPHWQRFTHQERNKYYKEYVKTWAKMPFSVGCHWYQFSDQHITGRAMDGENQPVGLVDIVDQPYQPLVTAIQASSNRIYEWHSGSK